MATNEPVTPVNFRNLSMTRYSYYSTSSGLVAVASGYDYYECPPVKTETKKEKQARVAKELMYASWQVYNQITMSIREVVQVCRPEHLFIKRTR